MTPILDSKHVQKALWRRFVGYNVEKKAYLMFGLVVMYT